MFQDTFDGKNVLVTGHTGFKGSWLTAWLLELNARVTGVSDRIPSQPAMFEEIGLEDRINHHFLDIRDLDALRELFDSVQPDYVFHLAAQSIVSRSYSDPVDTIGRNVIGTTNVLDVLRTSAAPCTAVIITSDKCYDNVEWEWGYRENDTLGGKDVYSGSKGAAELVFRSYWHSFFADPETGINAATARAGNVIGGGDWADDRIVADCMRAWSEGNKVTIRSPEATRPWQHVLEPLSGYLCLAMSLSQGVNASGESYNFGPRAEQNQTVRTLLEDLGKYWDFPDASAACDIEANKSFHEAGLLKLNCDKALADLAWQPTLHYDETIRFVSTWYLDFYRGGKDINATTQQQINEFQELARKRGRNWAG